MGKFTKRMTKSWTEFERAGSGDPFGESKTFINNLYQVSVDEDSEGALHLSIVRRDRTPIRDWRHLQRIKNEIAGPEREAVEVYPADSRLVDTNNQYHLWVFPKGSDIQIGFQQRHVTNRTWGAHKQRELDEGTEISEPQGARTNVVMPKFRAPTEEEEVVLIGERISRAESTISGWESELEELRARQRELQKKIEEQ